VYRQIDDYWEEPPADPSGYWTTHFDIRVVRSDAELRELARAGAHWVAIGESAARATGEAGVGPVVNDPRCLAHLDYYRAYKTRYEVLCMRAAQALAVRGHRAVAAAFKGGVSEFELGQIFLGATRQGETELPYPSIIAVNEHAATLHHRHLRKQPPAIVRSLLIDAGALHNGYAADITRTHSASPDDTFAALIGSMDKLQQAVCAEVRAGADFTALHLHAHRLLAAVLRAHGLVKCSAEEALDSGLTRTFLPHGLGHLLGLTVHDAAGRQIDAQGTLRAPPEGHPALRLTRELEPGFVVTIEPGLYFIPSLIRAALAEHGPRLDRARLERLLPFGGIRIEDDVEVLSDGARNLTREAFAASAQPRAR
jgi:Xaa-Pro dipeptidase